MADELRNLLKSQNISTLKPVNIKAVGGAVFPDVPAADDLNDFDQIVNAWQQVHVPTYGQPIPGTGAANFWESNTDNYASTNELWSVVAVSITSTAVAVTGYLNLGGIPIAFVEDAPSGVTMISIPSNVVIDAAVGLAFVGSFETTDVALNAITFTLVQ